MNTFDGGANRCENGFLASLSIVVKTDLLAIVLKKTNAFKTQILRFRRGAEIRNRFGVLLVVLAIVRRQNDNSHQHE